MLSHVSVIGVIAVLEDAAGVVADEAVVDVELASRVFEHAENRRVAPIATTPAAFANEEIVFIFFQLFGILETWSCSGTDRKMRRRCHLKVREASRGKGLQQSRSATARETHRIESGRRQSRRRPRQ